MSIAAPARISIPKDKWKPIKDETCLMMCPECYVRGTVLNLEDDYTTWGCPKCGITFSVDWGG